MKWATRAYVHLDRVATPWLIARFIDPDAEFSFVPWGPNAVVPADAIPLAIEGAELGPHDDAGTTFAKVLRKYGLVDPALDKMAAIVAAGVYASQHQGRPEGQHVTPPEGIGVMAISRGLMLLEPDDAQNLQRAMVIYDALYLYCQAQLAFEADPGLQGQPLVERTETLRRRVAAARDKLAAPSRAQ